MKIVLFVWTNINWRYFNDAVFEEQVAGLPSSFFHGRPRQHRCFRDKIALWNEIFCIPYFEYRQHLQDVAQQNWLQIRHLDAIVRDCSLVPIGKEGVVILPVDDDDWFHPEVSGFLESQLRAKDHAVTWKYSHYVPHAPNASRRIRGVGRRIFGSNAYAVTATYLAAIPASDRKNVLRSHGFSRHYFKKNETRGSTWRYLHTCMSMKNHSPASISTLASCERERLERFRESMRDRTSKIPTRFEWAAPFVRQCQELNKELSQ
jgi:hypothetical protein